MALGLLIAVVAVFVGGWPRLVPRSGRPALTLSGLEWRVQRTSRQAAGALLAAGLVLAVFLALLAP